VGFFIIFQMKDMKILDFGSHLFGDYMILDKEVNGV
jgi:hypothetical protein